MPGLTLPERADLYAGFDALADAAMIEEAQLILDQPEYDTAVELMMARYPEE